MGDLDRIFKAYDIRGRVDLGELDEATARAVGAAFGRMIDESAVAVGRDCRSSSPLLSEAVMEGVASVGVDVIDIGEVSTDVVSFVAGARNVAGVMITASHNPPEYNGIKLCRAGAAPVGEETGLMEIKAAVAAGPVATSAARGGRSSESVLDAYADHLFTIVDPSAIAGLTVALDGGNGMAGAVLPTLLDRLPITPIGIYLDPDGTFPNHPANPLEPENIRDLQALVARRGADLGVAFDGDADRAFFVDEGTGPLSGSATTALIARWFLASAPGSTIVHNLITSRAVPELIARLGGAPIRTRVGHSFIKQVMAETGAIFGGEHSGHYYFRDNFRADSGMLAMLILLQVLSEAGVPLSELRSQVEPYAQSGEINLTVTDKDRVGRAVVAAFAGFPIDHLDGITIEVDDSWFNLRPSNTEPVLRLNVEAPDADSVTRLVERVSTVIQGAN